MNEKVRVGVLGVGKLGEHHARNYAQMQDVELVGVFDVDNIQGQKIAKKYNIKFVQDVDELIKNIDAVSIVVPTPLHYEIAKKCLNANVHCLVEKPITTQIFEAEDLVNIAKQNQLVLQVGHIERFNAAVMKAKEYIHTPRFIEVNRLGPYDPRVSHVGVVLDLMIHDIEIVLALTKSEIVSIDAVGAKILSKFEDIANARIRFKNGCVANISASRVSLDKFRKIRIFQDDAYISLNYEKQNLKIYQKKVDEVKSLADIKVVRPRIKKQEPLKMELEHFVKCVRLGEDPIVTGMHGRNALDVALKIGKLIEENEKLKGNK